MVRKLRATKSQVFIPIRENVDADLIQDPTDAMSYALSQVALHEVPWGRNEPTLPLPRVPTASKAREMMPRATALDGALIDGYTADSAQDLANRSTLLTHAEYVLQPSKDLFTTIPLIMDGPPKIFCEFVESLSEAARGWQGNDTSCGEGASMIGLLLERLRSEAQALYDASESPDITPEEMSRRRNGLGKLLRCVESLSGKPGNEAMAAVWEARDVGSFLPLSDAEMFITLKVLRDAGKLSTTAESYVEVLLEVTCALQAGEGESLALFRQRCIAENGLAADPNVEGVRHHLRRVRQGRERQATRLWEQLVKTGDGPPLRRHLEHLQNELRRQVVLTAYAQSLSSTQLAQCSKSRSLLEKAGQFLEEALNIPSVNETFWAARRMARQHQGGGTGPTKIVDLSGNTVTWEKADHDTAKERALLGRAAEALLDTAGDTLRELSFWGQYAPEQVEQNFTPRLAALDRLEERGLKLDAGTRKLRTLVADLLQIAAQLKEQERATPLLYDLVLLRDQHKLLYCWLSTESTKLDEDLSVVLPRLEESWLTASSSELRVSSAETVTPQDASQTSDRPDSELSAQVVEACGAAVSQDIAASQQPEESADDGSWSVVKSQGRRRILSREAARKVNSKFYRGTFPSPVRSLVQHYLKHGHRVADPAPALEETGLLDYLDSAQQQCGRWEDAFAAGKGYVTDNRVEPAIRIRVIDDDDVYLAMTDEQKPRIVSFRDRERFGR